MGIDEQAIEALERRVRREVDDGLVPSCQAAVAYGGEVVAEFAAGDATTGSRYALFSCTKALIAAVMWQLIGEGRVFPTDTVVTHFEEFGANDKAAITIEQVMTHTAGFPRAPMGPPRWSDRAWRTQRMADWRLNWEPGSRFEYHPTSAHWVLAEVIARIDGRDHRDAVRERVLEPLGLSRLALGVAPADQHDIAELVVVGEDPTPAEVEAVFGAVEIDRGEITPEVLLAFNDVGVRAVGVPGGGAVSNAADLALLYQALLHNPGRLWDPAVLEDGRGTVRCRLPDPVTGIPANRTLGLVAAGDDGRAALRGMGHTVSPRAFGHNGAAGQIAWADPDSGLSFVYLTNGIDRHFLREARRTVSIASRAGLVGAADA
ncbi:MAG: serine hydrolase domain-containing protein [Microthrixaceae bacterium]